MIWLELESKVRSIEPSGDRVRVTFMSAAAVYWFPTGSAELESQLSDALRRGAVLKVRFDARTGQLLETVRRGGQPAQP